MESIKQRQTVTTADWTSLEPAQTGELLLPSEPISSPSATLEVSEPSTESGELEL